MSGKGSGLNLGFQWGHVTMVHGNRIDACQAADRPLEVGMSLVGDRKRLTVYGVSAGTTCGRWRDGASSSELTGHHGAPSLARTWGLREESDMHCS